MPVIARFFGIVIKMYFSQRAAIPGAEVEKANAQGERASLGGSAPDRRFFSDGKLLIGVP
ncbi:MAG: hypothetical protein AUK55_07685 [Syntrophobacteraceae bacterium CG2_30_61_12]|nr:MAG: hypothetical protein AUK55_07685 [Syntrophobacteraceae bacterium CG2_30_61_12]